MLARTPSELVAWEAEYSGFPRWEVLISEPGQERRAADRVANICGVEVYWPHYTTHNNTNPRRPGHSVPRRRSVIPSVLLSPVELLSISRRQEVLRFAGLRTASFGRYLSKAEVEVIRDIAGRLDQEARKRADHQFEVGQRVSFTNATYCAFLGSGTILGLAKSGRVSVRIDAKLFGGQDVITVPAAELEAIGLES